MLNIFRLLTVTIEVIINIIIYNIVMLTIDVSNSLDQCLFLTMKHLV